MSLSRAQFGRLIRRAAQGIVIAYPLSLAVVAGLLHFVGEAHWATTLGLYLPPLIYLAPLLPVAVVAVWLGPRSLRLAPLAALMVGLFPLMGFCWSWLRSGEAEPRLRLLSYNVDSLAEGAAAITREILARDLDLVLLQESTGREEIATLLKQRYPFVETSTQFVIASRFPIRETTDPPRIPYGDRLRSPRFMRHLIETPLGTLAVYNIHPLSPRESFFHVRGAGLRREIASGRIFRGAHGDLVDANTQLRVLQLEAIERMVRLEKHPVVVAGDTNLPSPSPLLRRTLGFLQDGFERRGRGFGYTFPTKHPFLRLDRILAGNELRFVHFEVGCGRVSDHHCVMADLTRSH